MDNTTEIKNSAIAFFNSQLEGGEMYEATTVPYSTRLPDYISFICNRYAKMAGMSKSAFIAKLVESGIYDIAQQRGEWETVLADWSNHIKAIREAGEEN